MDSLADDLAFAAELARSAGELIADQYEQVLRIDRKSKRDVVTDVDYRSEALVMEAIRSRRPNDAILAEESGHHAQGRGGGRRWGTRTWVIDPLDGTVNYANGIPYFCVSVALVEDGRPTVGVILDPLRGEQFAATADGTATLNGVPIHASEKEELGDFVVAWPLSGEAGLRGSGAWRRRSGSPGAWGALRWRWPMWGQADSMRWCRTGASRCGTLRRPD
jgi:Archaeal fructose-1,6-bisphosphatase and related enzymes of inositol monophosphatase family